MTDPIGAGQLFWAVIVVLVTNAVVAGAFAGTVKSDVKHVRDEIAEIKAKLGNGEPGVFVRREERLAERIDRLEDKMDHS